jgi:hypothetical protein
LNRKLLEASKRALVFCTTADRGHVSAQIWPESGNIIKVSASNAYGVGLDAAEPVDPESEKVDFMLDGDEIIASGPCYMKTKQDATVNGSSVATALASGIASLIIVLATLEDDSDHIRKRLRKKAVMKRYFKKMYNDDKKRVVIPAKLFDLDYASQSELFSPRFRERFTYVETPSDREEEEKADKSYDEDLDHMY